MRHWNTKRDRRDAVTAFLKKIITDPEVRVRVLRERQAAHQALEREGDIDLPDDVEVICVGPSTRERDRVIAIVLPPEGLVKRDRATKSGRTKLHLSLSRQQRRRTRVRSVRRLLS